MRRATLMIAVTLTFLSVSGSMQSASQKPLPADVGAGRIAWFDITTTDLAKSKDFYGKLFGWQFNTVQGSDQAAEIVAGGTAIGTMRSADGKISPFNGVVYVQVSDIRASCAKAKELGGMIPPGF